MSLPDFPAAPPSAFMHGYDRMLRIFDKVISYVVIAAMGILSATLVAQVFFRYALNDSLDWGNDVPRLTFIAVVFLSIPLGFRYNAHVSMDFDLTKVKFIDHALVNRFNAVAMLVLFGLVAYYAVQMMESTWDQMMPGMNVPVGSFYLTLAVGQVHCCLHVLRALITGELPEEHFSE